MVVEQWPLTVNGKVDKKALPIPDASMALQGEYIAPQTQAEHTLVDIWAGLLAMDAQHISTTANFFDLGGHSLLTVKLLSTIHQRFDKACELSSLFNEPTIQSQGAMLDSLDVGLENKPLLQKMTDNPSAKQGIIFIPGVASTANDFKQIVSQLGQTDIGVDTQIGIFRHKGLIAGEQYFNTIEQNVAAFADSFANSTLEKVTLVGHSYGGVLAFELAKQLQAKHYQVELVMLDTYFEQHSLDMKKSKKSAHTNAMQAFDMPSYMQDLYLHQATLFEQYQPQVSEILPMTLVFAKQSPFTQQQYKEYLAQQLPDQQLNYLTVDGDHFTMLKGNSAELISQQLRGLTLTI
jgi:thioesterase domain-containing protein/acyl carrier protein